MAGSNDAIETRATHVRAEAESGFAPVPMPQGAPPPFPQAGAGESPATPDWQCQRIGAVSGRYEGEMTMPQAGRYLLDLRIDVDPLHATSPVMNRVSGDLYQVDRIAIPGQPARVWRTYIESWIVDRPQVDWERCEVTIIGDVRFWAGEHAATTVAIRIGWGSLESAGPALVTFTESGGAQRSFSCRRVADAFRDVDLEIDVCDSVKESVLLPSYDTHAHPDRPAGLPRRTLSIKACYADAGVSVTIDPDHSVIDDSDSEFESWSPAELHDVMETHFSHFSGSWPSWHLWGLMAGRYESPSVGGIMFDAAARVGGAGKAPERQGFALFRKHSWFDKLETGAPQEQAWAMRHFLYTWVHEAGHAFNFLHSWNKGRPDSLSYMNYDWRYDQRNGQDEFWKRFQFRFDDEELIHVRHGAHYSVAMGGDPWSSGTHMEAPNLAMAQVEGNPPLELLVRSRGYFELMEPVHIELRLRNLLTDLPISIDRRLGPEFGTTILLIQKPDGSIVTYDPIMCAVGEPDSLTLQPASAGEGEDRYSREIFLTYGADGFYFAHPGEYGIRAIYQGAGDILITSQAHRVRIGTPSAEADCFAQDFFSDDVGLVLYLKGSRSPYLEAGTTVLEEAVERFSGTMLGAKVADTLANGLARPFFRVEDPAAPKLVKTARADPAAAIAITDPALELVRGSERKESNLLYGRLVRRRAEYHQQTGDPENAKAELRTLQRELAERGANAAVVKRYDDLERSF